MLTVLDYAVIVVYFIATAAFGLMAGGKQRTTNDYFLGGRGLPWWAVCFSIVATETSTLTVISVPAIAYGGSLTFLQLTFGYLLGRIIISIYFLPRYFKGDLTTAYALLGNRFGDGMRATASITFLFTRLLADGVRLFATAIPLKIIFATSGLDVSYTTIILAIGFVTIIYTLVGGIKAVIWMDVIQMMVYVGGAIVAAIILLNGTPAGWFAEALDLGKVNIFDWGGPTWSDRITSPYAAITAIGGGALFSMASHGTDQLIVQRLLTTKTLRDSQKAIITSGVLVILQFALFLFVGLLLWGYYEGADFAALGVTRGDEIFPKFMIEGLPPGMSGLILAGIMAAAMSTLSSSLNSLASSSLFDLYERLSKKKLPDEKALLVSRGLTFFWGFLFMVFAIQFTSTENPVVELGLAIASFTYGGLLGSFLLAILNHRARQIDAIIAFIATVLVLIVVVRGIWYVPEIGWTLQFVKPLESARTIGWPWYPFIGAVVTLTVGGLLSLRHRS